MRQDDKAFCGPENHRGFLTGESYDESKKSLVVVSSQGFISDSSFNFLQVNLRPQVALSYSGKPCTDSSLLFTPTLIFNGNIPAGSFCDFGDGRQLPLNDTGAVSHAYSNPARNIKVRYSVYTPSGCTSDTAVLTIPPYSSCTGRLLYHQRYFILRG